MGRILIVSIALLLVASAAVAEVIPFTAEVGYRWVNIGGNMGLYRTQINERSGLLIRTFSMYTPELRIDSTDLGVGPASSLRIETANSSVYRLRLGYRTLSAFSELPAFANPLLSQGVLVGQHSFDRSRTLVDADLELLPNGAVTPFVGYSWNRNDGPGRTTYFVGQNEFQLLQDLQETDREIRAGTSFRTAYFSGQITQGWRQFRGTEFLSLAAGDQNGNNSAPILGQPVTASQITSTNNSRVNTPFTNLYVTARPAKRIKVVGSFSRFSATSNNNGGEDLSGSFVSFPLSRDFSALTEAASGRVKNTTWRGAGRAEIALREGIDFITGYQREHRDMDGASLINTLYLQSVAFGGVTKSDLQTVLSTTNSLGRNEDVVNAGVSARAFGPFAVRAEVRQTQQDFNVAPDIAEIVVPGASQGGDFKRRVRTFDTGGTFAKAGFTLGASWKRDRANTPVFRTDFIDRDRYRARAGWATKERRLALGLAAEQTKQNNDQSEIGFNGKLRQFTGDIEVAPFKLLRLRGSASQYRADTNIIVRQPQNFLLDESVHFENGRSREGGFALLLKKASVDAGVTRFTNEGSIPFNIDRYRVRTTFDLKAKAGLAAEWYRDRYRQPGASFSDFDADRYGLYLRWTP